ncbi:hypothetical protein BDV32DRAFT_74304 [Aspergillus pseudonomiae]|nr:hypothetical protein BDV32DRAFT_74304 [Aspergillus pseudonomiae]
MSNWRRARTHIYGHFDRVAKFLYIRISLPETRACPDGKFSACTIHRSSITRDASDLPSMRAVETLSLLRATYAKHGWRGNRVQPADQRMNDTNILTGNEAAWNKEERRLWVRRAAKKRFVHRYQTCLRGLSFYSSALSPPHWTLVLGWALYMWILRMLGRSNIC